MEAERRAEEARRREIAEERAWRERMIQEARRAESEREERARAYQIMMATHAAGERARAAAEERRFKMEMAKLKRDDPTRRAIRTYQQTLGDMLERLDVTEEDAHRGAYFMMRYQIYLDTLPPGEIPMEPARFMERLAREREGMMVREREAISPELRERIEEELQRRRPPERLKPEVIPPPQRERLPAPEEAVPALRPEAVLPPLPIVVPPPDVRVAEVPPRRRVVRPAMTPRAEQTLSHLLTLIRMRSPRPEEHIAGVVRLLRPLTEEETIDILRSIRARGLIPDAEIRQVVERLFPREVP